MNKSTMIVGIGSAHGDDQAGWRVADRLAAESSQPGLIWRARSPTDLLGRIDHVEQLIVCDACRGAGPVGSLHRWTWPLTRLEDVVWSGTHDLPLTTVLAMAERLGGLPRTVVIWAVEAAASEPGQPMSDALAEALPELCRRVRKEWESLDQSPAAAGPGT